MNKLRKYLRIWMCLVRNSFKTQMSTSLASTGYLIGKLMRMGFFLAYLLALFSHLPSLKGYSVYQVVLFFMTFNIVDVSAQFLFRGLYSVKTLIEEGDFDKILTQPAHVLFRISSMGVDMLDLFTMGPIIGVTIWAMAKVPGGIDGLHVFFYFLLLLNSLIISYAFHVIVGGMSVRTQELESAIWVYRDVMALGRFPVAIYSDILRMAFVTVVPIAVMISFPAQALLGLLSWKGILYSFAVGVCFHLFAQWFWRRSLMNYTSVST